jgi:hypothetical protein
MRVVALVLLASLAGCLVQDPSSQPMCRKDDDCDQGEVCGLDHICYGNLPAAALSAIVSPPIERTDLAPTEIVDFTPSGLGSYSVSFADTIELAGRVVLTDHPEVSVAARMVFRRRSRLPGGPDLVITTTSAAGKVGSEPSFRVQVPPSADASEAFTVTIFPDDTPPVDDPGTPSPADLAPPYRRGGFVFNQSSTDMVIPLGGGDGAPGKKIISGRLLTAASLPLAGYDVRAYGRFSAADPLEVASSRGHTDVVGAFSVLVPAGWQDDFELRLTPPPDRALPTVVLPVVHVADPTSAAPVVASVGTIRLPLAPAAVPYVMQVAGAAPGGGTEALRDATVTLTTVILDSDDLVVTYQSTAVVDSEGDAALTLVPGTTIVPRDYLIDVVPPGDSEHQQIYARPISVGAPGSELTVDDVPMRILVTGVLLDENGLPASGVAVTSLPTAAVADELAVDPVVPLARLVWPETVTDDRGRFALWLDQHLGEVTVGYELTFEPPVDSLLPRFTLDDLYPLADAAGRNDLAEVSLPAAAYAHGTIIDQDGVGVPGATIRVYLRAGTAEPCAVKPCLSTAILLGQDVAGEEGTTRLALPRL